MKAPKPRRDRFSFQFLTTFRRSRLASKMIDGVVWLTLGSVPSRALTLLATILVVRILGKEVYGEFSLVRSTVNAFMTVACFGMGRTAAKYVSELLVVDKNRAGRIVALNYAFTLLSSFTVALLFFIFAPELCEQTLRTPHLVFQIRVSSILLVLSALAGAQTGVLAGFQAFKETAFALTISGFLSFPFFVCGALFGGLTGAILGFSSGIFFNCILNSWYIYKLLQKHNVRYQFWGCWHEASVLWNFCLPSTLASLLSSLVAWGTAVLLTRQENGSAELGILDAARQIQTAVLYLPVMAVNVVVPTLSELNALQDHKRYRQTIKYNIVVNAVFTFVISLFVALLSPWIMPIFGKGFEEGVTTLIILLATGVAMSVINVCGSVLTSLGLLWERFWLTILWGSVVIIGIKLISSHIPGAVGVAIVMGGAYSLRLLGNFIIVRQFFKVRNNIDDTNIQQ